ncbi:MAG TPA: hypothetical protein VLX64_06565, partial [Thermoplasmata archaeon]|nr:hypothetical protein [Thermoplasmata archaeon]
PVGITLRRKLASRLKINYYEAGMDLGLSDDVEESYRRFQTRLKREYERIAATDRFTVIDATRRVEEIQATLRTEVRPLLENFPTGERLTHDG